MNPRLVTAAATVVGPEEANDVAEALPIDGSLKGRLVTRSFVPLGFPGGPAESLKS
jgi:hypothetical protein